MPHRSHQKRSEQLSRYLEEFDRREAFLALWGQVPGYMLASAEAQAYFHQFFARQFDANRWYHARVDFMTEFLANWTAAWTANFGYGNAPARMCNQG